MREIQLIFEGEKNVKKKDFASLVLLSIKTMGKINVNE